MTTPMLSALLIAGFAVTASAAPETGETPARIRYQPETSAPARTVADGEWLELASPTPARHGAVFIPVEPGAGTFSKLRIDAAKGYPHVRELRIEYRDGRSRVIPVKTQLSYKHKREQSRTFKLDDSREVRQIVVVGDRKSYGSYTVHAQASVRAVASR